MDIPKAMIQQIGEQMKAQIDEDIEKLSEPDNPALLARINEMREMSRVAKGQEMSVIMGFLDKAPKVLTSAFMNRIAFKIILDNVRADRMNEGKNE